jgi:dTDP-4-dehydrorhamnose 3,5-epimerase
MRSFIKMLVEPTAIPDVLIITPRVFADPRGFFFESYSQKAFRTCGIDTIFMQDNHSKSVKGTLRGLHFQLPPAAQIKLVRVVRGTIWDVAADIRQGSPTFGKWVGTELSAENYRQLYVPVGFAHGFCVLTDEAEILYKTSNLYDPTLERGILWNDPTLDVAWPVREPLLSARDQRAGTLADYLVETPFVYSAQPHLWHADRRCVP